VCITRALETLYFTGLFGGSTFPPIFAEFRFILRAVVAVKFVVLCTAAFLAVFSDKQFEGGHLL
jgi:hypothetical protein